MTKRSGKPFRQAVSSAFRVPSLGNLGAASRNILDGSGCQNANLALVKHVTLPGASRLQLRAEAFNLLDHTNCNLPDTFLGLPMFGRIVSPHSPRRFQFGIRSVF